MPIYNYRLSYLNMLSTHNKLLFFFLLIIQTVHIFAQIKGTDRSVSLVGKVLDSFTEIGQNGTKITLMTSDSIEISNFEAMVFNNDAFFSFRVPARKNKYILKVEHKDYETTYMTYDLKRIGRNTQIDLPCIYMKRRSRAFEKTLEQLEVVATKIKVVHRGDTVIFNADAFNVADGSMLDGLIKQLPGVELKDNGEIFVNGKKIDYMLLNGKDFFKGNNRVMLENLPYYMVQNVKVYYRDTERTVYAGLENEKKDYVMDVNMKRQYQQGYIANVEAGGGTQDAFWGRLFGMRFTDHSRITLIGNANNLNSEYKPWGDGQWDENNDFYRIGRTTRETLQGNVSIDTDKWKNDTEVYVGWADAKNEDTQYAETILAADSIMRDSTYNQDNTSSFNVSARNTFTLKVPFYFLMQTNILYSDSKNISSQEYKSPASFQDFHSTTNARKISLSHSIASTYKLNWGDVIDVSALINYDNNKLRGTENRQTLFMQSNFYNNYDINSSFSNLNFQLGTTYSIKDFRNGTYKLSLSYAQKHHLEQDTRFDINLLARDEQNSYNLKQTNRFAKAAFSYTYEKWTDESNTSFVLSLPLRFANQCFVYSKDHTDTSSIRNYWLFEPSLSFSYGKKRRTIDFKIDYESILPDALMLVNTANTTNTLHWYVGNQHLKNEKILSNSIFYLDNSHKTRQHILKAKWNWYQDKITQSYSYNTKTGRFVHKPINIDGVWHLSIGSRNSWRLGDESPYYISSETSVGYAQNQNYVTTETFKSTERKSLRMLDIKETLIFTYEKGNNRVDVKGDIQWQRSALTNKSMEQDNIMNYSYGVDATLKLPAKISFMASLGMIHHRGYSTPDFNSNNCVCNITIGRHFLRGDKMLVRLTAVDLFRSYTSVKYSLNEYGSTELQSFSLPSYFLLRLSYKWNLNKKRQL